MAQLASEHEAVIQENEMLKQELNAAREELQNLHRHQEESEVKLKTDVKVLVKEVKLLRNSQTELKQELSKVMKEKLEAEVLFLFREINVAFFVLYIQYQAAYIWVSSAHS